jgi:hypothetical protein
MLASGAMNSPLRFRGAPEIALLLVELQTHF